MAGDVETVDLELVADVTVEAHAVTEATGRRLDFVVDKPSALGGTDRGPMPSEYFLAAIASCNLMTARRIADKRGVPYAGLRCRALAHFEGSDISKVVLAFHVESAADAEAWETVFRLAERSCTISRATSCPIERTISLATPV